MILRRIKMVTSPGNLGARVIVYTREELHVPLIVNTPANSSLSVPTLFAAAPTTTSFIATPPLPHLARRVLPSLLPSLERRVRRLPLSTSRKFSGLSRTSLTLCAHLQYCFPPNSAFFWTPSPLGANVLNGSPSLCAYAFGCCRVTHRAKIPSRESVNSCRVLYREG